MPCSSCVDKLAYRLMLNHKIDMIRAYELAEKGIERHENEDSKPLPIEIKSGTGNPSDYTQVCTQGGTPNCKAAGTACTTSAQCKNLAETCTCLCPAPLPNSHVTGVCTAAPAHTCICNLGTSKCLGGNCTGCVGTCPYDCDAGAVWNPVTLVCDLIPAPSGISGNSMIIAVSMLAHWINRRRKRRFIVTLK